MPADLLTRVRVEIDARLAELRPALAEHERLLHAADALEADVALARERPGAEQVPAGAVQPVKPASPAEEAIVAALEHGSHTLGELVLVSAISGRDIREGLRRLQRAGTITRARREGRAAYALTRLRARPPTDERPPPPVRGRGKG